MKKLAELVVSTVRNHRGLVAFVASVVLLSISAAIAGPVVGTAVLALAALVAVTMLLEVELPWGGSVPLGHAVVIALVELLTVSQFAVVLAFGFLAIFPAKATRFGITRAAVLGLGVVASATAARVAFELLIRYVDPLRLDSPDVHEPAIVLCRVIVVGSVYLAVDLACRSRFDDNRAQAATRKESAPIDLTFISAAALLAIAYWKSGPAASAVAFIPLLVTRYSFQRYAEARKTYAQTTQALSMLPEVAGLSPLGHGERTSVYAGALAESFNFGPEVVDRIRTAARLHHIGHISLPDPAERRFGSTDAQELGILSGELLRETGFLADVADLVQDIQISNPATLTDRAVAIVRVASSFDDIVGENPDRAEVAVVQVQALHNQGVERRAAIELARLVDDRPSLAEEARLAGEPYTEAAKRSGQRSFV